MTLSDLIWTRDYWRRPYSTTQVAELLGISHSTVIRLIETGELPARRTSLRGKWQIPRPAVHERLRCTVCHQCGKCQRT